MEIDGRIVTVCRASGEAQTFEAQKMERITRYQGKNLTSTVSILSVQYLLPKKLVNYMVSGIQWLI